MQIESIWWYFIMMAVFFAEAAVLCALLPSRWQPETGARAGARLTTMDGLRGVLALSVFLHHCALYYRCMLYGRLMTVTSNFYAQMGVMPVTLFFFITGFLFWSKLRKRQPIAWLEFLRERLARLGAAYWVACCLFFILIAASSHFHRHVSARLLGAQIVGWLSFLGAGHDMNGLPTSRAWFGQVWTLRMEWCFYLSLPLFAWFARKRLRLLLLVGCAALADFLIAHVNLPGPSNVIWKTAGDYLHFLSFAFGAGMFIAVLPQAEKLRAFARSAFALGLSILTVAVVTLWLPADYGWLESLALLLPFACVCLGNSWLGLLVSAPMQLLGRISYSFYLLHGFVLHVGLLLLQRAVPLASLSAVQYWAFAGGCGIIAVVVSCISWQFLERPFLKGIPVRELAAVEREPYKGAVPAAASRAIPFPASIAAYLPASLRRF